MVTNAAFPIVEYDILTVYFEAKASGEVDNQKDVTDREMILNIKFHMGVRKYSKRKECH